MAKRFERLGRPVAEVMAALDAMRSQDLDWRGGRVPPPIIVGPGLMFLFPLRARLVFKSRPACVVRFAVRLMGCLARSIFPARVAAGVLRPMLGAVPGFCGVRPLRRRISLGSRQCRSGGWRTGRPPLGVRALRWGT